MTTARRTLLILLFTTLIFDRLFWHQAIGLNLALFAALILVLVLFDRGWKSLTTGARASGAGVLVSAIMLVINGSTIATFSVFTGLFVFAGLAHERQLRTTTTAVIQWMVALVRTPVTLFDLGSGAIGTHMSVRRKRGWIGLLVLPLVITTVYFFLYRGANSRFEAMTAGFMDGIGNLLSDLFTNVLTPHTLFIGAGLVFCASLLLRADVPWLPDFEGVQRDGLLRVREKRPTWKPKLALNALDRERRMGVLLLFLVNVLLVPVNLIDIHWLWFGFEVPTGFSLKEFVHEGTWLLIISILLSMLILFHLFRSNLNFHPQNRWLRRLAIIWLVQNFILGISVFLRNYHYIAFHGLAYKRIGVIVFLVLMLVGLITLFVKIRERRTFFYLIRVNGWAVFIMMVALTTMDWDSAIVRYNLHHWNKGEIDVDNYFAMSDKVLPLLYDDIADVREQMAKHRENEVRWIEHLDNASFDQDLDAKRTRFLQRYVQQDWQSWSWADQRTYRALVQRNLAAY